MKNLSPQSTRKALLRILKDPGKNKINISNKELLSVIKNQLPSDSIEEVFSLLPKHRQVALLENITPNHSGEIRKHKLSAFGKEISHELGWLVFALKLHCEEINLYLTTKQEIENDLILGNYDDGLKKIETLDKVAGVSIWSIEKQFQFYELKHGFEAHKKKLSQYLTDQSDPLVRVLLYHISMRIESNISTKKFNSELDKYIAKHRHQKKLSGYLRAKLNQNKIDGSENIKSFLSIQSNFPLIDRYEGYIQALLMMLTFKSSASQDIVVAAKSIHQLFDSIKDPRLSKLGFLLKVSPNYNISENEIDILKITELFIHGEYTECITKSRLFLAKNPTCFEIIDIYSKALIFGQETDIGITTHESILNSIITCLLDLYSKNESYLISKDHLEKYSIFLGSSSLGLSIWNTTVRETSENRNIEQFNHNIFSDFSNNYFHPRMFIIFNDESINSTTINIVKSVTQDLFWENYLNVIHHKESPDLLISNYNNWSKLFVASMHHIFGEKTRALEIYNELSIANNNFNNSYSAYIYYEAILGIILIHIENGEYLSAIEKICSILINRPDFYERVRSNKLILFAKNELKEEVTANISIPIFMFFFGHMESNDVWISYDNFLHSNHLNIASEIETIKDRFSIDTLVFFLKEVCIPEIYDSSIMFESQEDLDNERIKICSLLIELDPNNKAHYTTEISEFSRKIRTKIGKQQIDKSKIYVNVDGIWDRNQKDWTELFKRIQDLNTLDIESIKRMANTTGLFLFYFEDNIENPNGKIKKLATPKSILLDQPIFIFFKDFFLDIRDQFIRNTHYGLDSYISMRIRHGTLLGQIRSIFTKPKFITRSEISESNLKGPNKQYHENKYWIDLLCTSNTNEKTKNQISQAFNTFSQEIDRASEDIKNKLLQIKTEIRSNESNDERKNTLALFDYSYTEEELITLFTNNFTQITTVELFFKTSIDALWEKTDSILVNIRNEFSVNTRAVLSKILEKLESSIYKIIQSSNLPNKSIFTQEITNCKTQLAVELEIISHWFTRNDKKGIFDFIIQDSIDISLSSISKIFPNKNLSPRINVDSKKRFHGKYLEMMTDIFQNIFDNILTNAKPGTAEIKIYESGSKLKIQISNQVDETSDVEQMNIKIENTIHRLKKIDEEGLSNKEGGSGYLKIKKTLLFGLNRKTYSIQLSRIDPVELRFISSIEFELNQLTMS